MRAPGPDTAARPAAYRRSALDGVIDLPEQLGPFRQVEVLREIPIRLLQRRARERHVERYEPRTREVVVARWGGVLGGGCGTGRSRLGRGRLSGLVRGYL